MRWAIHLNWWANGVRLVLLVLSAMACANAEITDNANNASLTPPQGGPSYDQALNMYVTGGPCCDQVRVWLRCFSRNQLFCESFQISCLPCWGYWALTLRDVIR